MSDFDYDAWPIGAVVIYEGQQWVNTHHAPNAWEPGNPQHMWEQLPSQNRSRTPLSIPRGCSLSARMMFTHPVPSSSTTGNCGAISTPLRIAGNRATRSTNGHR